jgi:hypothetical protein
VAVARAGLGYADEGMSRSSRSPKWALVALGLAGLALAGCGQSHELGNPQVPLIRGAQVLQQIRRCDEGSDAFCSLAMVVINPLKQSSGEFLVAERKHLRQLGWTVQDGEILQERSAVSPGHKLRIVYATAAGDLLALDQGWIKRPDPIGKTLSRMLFAGLPTISLMVEAGPA